MAVGTEQESGESWPVPISLVGELGLSVCLFLISLVL